MLATKWRDRKKLRSNSVFGLVSLQQVMRTVSHALLRVQPGCSLDRSAALSCLLSSFSFSFFVCFAKRLCVKSNTSLTKRDEAMLHSHLDHSLQARPSVQTVSNSLLLHHSRHCTISPLLCLDRSSGLEKGKLLPL